MVEIRKETMLIAATTLLLLFGVGSAQADDACHEARRTCQQDAQAASSVCRSDCRSDVGAAIAAARETCDVQNLERDECRELVRDSVGAVATECRGECKGERKDERNACRQTFRECREAVIDPLDDECVDACREEFGPCHEEKRACHNECRTSARDTATACQEAGLPFREMLMCMREASQSVHACTLDCRDNNSCDGSIGECLRECSVEEP